MGSAENSRPVRPPERASARLAVALAAACVAHAVALALAARAGALGPSARAHEVALASLSAQAWEANRAVAGLRSRAAALPPQPAPPIAATRRPAAREPEREPEGQVVSVAPSQDPRPPERARFLAERDGRVERETRARVTGRFDTPAPKPIAAGAGAGAAAGGELGDAEESRTGALGARRDDGAPALAAAPSAPGPDADADGGSGERRRHAALAALRAAGDRSGEDGARRAGAYDPRLLPTAATLGELAGGPSDDVLDGVAEGDATFLSTRGWRYAEFLNRVKREVSAAWDPEAPLARQDPEGRLDRRGTWTTSVAVVLDPSGALKGVEVRRSSGRAYLDVAALDAFRKAQPFPNPPRGLVDARGEVRFKMSLRYRPPLGSGLGDAAAAILGPPPPGDARAAP